MTNMPKVKLDRAACKPASKKGHCLSLTMVAESRTSSQ